MLAALASAALLGAPPAGATPTPELEERRFSEWLTALRAEGRRRGISDATLGSALDGVEPLSRVIELDRSQPRAPSDFCRYLERRLTATRIARGRKVLEEEAPLLAEIAGRFGVPPRYLVALWGLETNFGDYLGDYPVMASLVTLAYDARREELFREQLFAALRIVEEGHRGVDQFMGSWAGATGQVQLMPTTFLEYAVDYDGDGRKDIWNSMPDAFATAAHYLRRSGWRSGEIWGRQVDVPAELAGDAPALASQRSIGAWQDLGVRRVDGSDLPRADIRGRIVLPLRGPAPAFLVYRNYRTFLAWNQSTFFAISLGTLADKLSGKPTLRACGL